MASQGPNGPDVGADNAAIGTLAWDGNPDITGSIIANDGQTRPQDSDCDAGMDERVSP